MMTLTGILLLLGAINACYGQNEPIDPESLQRVFGDNIFYPCEEGDTFMQCIRDYFEEHSNCLQNYDTLPDQIKQAGSSYYFPSINISLTQENNYITGLTGYVSKFYVNQETGNTVISISFTPHTITTDTNIFTYYLKGYEPIETKASSEESFPSFEATTTFPGESLDLSASLTFGFLNGVPELSLYNPTDDEQPSPQIRYMLSQLRAHHDVFVRESFVARSRFYAKLFIQSCICDFEEEPTDGLKPESNPVYF